MKSVYKNLTISPLTGNLREDVFHFLRDNGLPNTASHSRSVGDEARKIAARYGVNQESASVAGYLHDISAVFPSEVRISVAHRLGIEVLTEEETFPMIIHQKISKEMARDIFNIHEEDILSAVGCHTTLKKDSGDLDKVLFVADKIKWDQPGEPPYLHEIKRQLEHSLDLAAFEYIQYLWVQKEKLKVVHPWLKDAYYELVELVER